MAKDSFLDLILYLHGFVFVDPHLSNEEALIDWQRLDRSMVDYHFPEQ